MKGQAYRIDKCYFLFCNKIYIGGEDSVLVSESQPEGSGFDPQCPQFTPKQDKVPQTSSESTVSCSGQKHLPKSNNRSHKNIAAIIEAANDLLVTFTTFFMRYIIDFSMCL